MIAEQADIIVLGSASGLRGLVAVSKKEGKLLGKVSHVFIDTKEKALLGLVVKDEFWSQTRQHIPMDEIDSIGEDVVFIKSEQSCQSVKDLSSLPGQSVRDLQGHWITTDEGKHLGHFVDANFSSDTWLISELIMSDEKILEVEALEIVFGADEIIIPASYLAKVRKQKKRKQGILSKVFGEDTSEQISKTISKGSQPPKKSKTKNVTETNVQI